MTRTTSSGWSGTATRATRAFGAAQLHPARRHAGGRVAAHGPDHRAPGGADDLGGARVSGESMTADREYLNRLSDLLFILARRAPGDGDVLWKPAASAERAAAGLLARPEVRLAPGGAASSQARPVSAACPWPAPRARALAIWQRTPTGPRPGWPTRLAQWPAEGPPPGPAAELLLGRSRKPNTWTGSLIRLVAGHAQPPRAARHAQRALHRAAAPFQQVPAKRDTGGQQHHHHQEDSEDPGRVEGQVSAHPGASRGPCQTRRRRRAAGPGSISPRCLPRPGRPR